MAVRSFLHYALEVPDQAIGQRYYEDFGLVDVTGANKAVRLKPARQDRQDVGRTVSASRRNASIWSGRPKIRTRSPARTMVSAGGFRTTSRRRV